MEKIEKASAKLILEQPFFGSLATKIQFKKNNSIVGVNYKGNILEYNSEYLEALKTDEVATILATASMQQALYHSNRGKTKIKSLWQVASEYAINSLLAENGFIMHPLAKYNQNFSGLYAEEIYHILLSDYDIKEQNEIEKEQIEHDENFEDFELFLEQVIEKLSKQDELPDGIERLIPQTKVAKISWRELLYNYIQSHAKLDYSMFPANKKHLYRGFSLPSINSEMLKIAVAIDTSASINEEELSQFLTELEEILQSFRHYEIELIECDHKIQTTTRLTPLEPINYSLKGGGATDFTPVFEYIENLNEDFKFLIYFSDAQGVFPKIEPIINTLWILTKEAEVPFGEKIIL